MKRVFVTGLVFVAALSAFAADTPKQTTPAAPAAPAAMGQLVVGTTIPFRQNEPSRIDALVGPLRVTELRVTQTGPGVFEQIAPPRGGVSRFSYQVYGFAVENPTAEDWKLGVRVRLVDRNGAIIDEFEFRRDVDAGKARIAELRRLTLNYAIPLIDHLEITFSAER